MSFRVLFAASEAYPLIKTGGLADVAGSLPQALLKRGNDVRVVLPAYQDVLKEATNVKVLLETRVNDQQVRLLKTTLPGSRVQVWLVDCPVYFDRPGNPYHDETGKAWPDNAQRFALFCRVIVMIANNQFSLKWSPQILHLNDWQTGLVPVWLREQINRPAIVFTIHNLAYLGTFDWDTFNQLGLPHDLWHFEKLEFYGKFAFMKGGLLYSDRVNTVSPTYAKEIQHPELGHGLQGVMQSISSHLSGILNGIDTRKWNPGTDVRLGTRYNRRRLSAKLANKIELQEQIGLNVCEDTLLMGMVSRIVHQKGIDIVLEAIPALMEYDVQLVTLGSGDVELEHALLDIAEYYPHRIAVNIGYTEKMAHRVEAGCDVFLMPSMFEPCGLNQMYSQRYGTLPIVTPVGGLVDTVVDASDEMIQAKKATGFVMRAADTPSLIEVVERALVLFQDKNTWQQLQRTAMAQDFSWLHSADAYHTLYAEALADKRAGSW